MRDFQSYDPGRYYWGALWIKILGDGGIISFRFNYAAFQFIEWFSALDSPPANIEVLVGAGGGRSGDLDVDGVYESVIMISAIYFAVLLIERPSNFRHFMSAYSSV